MQSIYRLIATHASALARMTEAPDSIRDGEINPVWQQASDDERAALTRLIEAKPRNTVELRRKADYLLLHVRHGETFDREDTEALIQSMNDLILQPA